MSLRDLFTAKAETHSRKHRLARQAEVVPAQVERLEARALLSAIVPGLNSHGFVFTNASVAGRTSVVLDGSINSQISGNVNGAGLFLDVNGNTSMRELTLRGLQAGDNGSAGAIVNLSNLQLDRLVIAGSVFAENGTAGSGAGLVLQLNNAQIGEIVITNSQFNLNEFDGLRLTAAGGSHVTSLRILNSRATQNVASDGMAFLLGGSSVTNFGFANNLVQENGGNGFQLKLTNTPVENLVVRDNVADGNLNGHGVFLDFIGSAATASVFRNQFTNQTGGDGLRIRTQFSASGLRNINLAKFTSNTFEGNSGNGFFANLARDTTIRGEIRGNVFRNNGGIGFGAEASDTENAIDVTVGGFRRVNNQLVDANVFDQNTGAGIALTLKDPSGLLGDTTGRVRILANTITGTVAGNLPFTGQGIVIRAVGSTVLANGAARWSQVRIDGNLIRQNASHGVFFDISEDSQLVDAIVGNNTGTKLRFDVDGDFSVPGQQIIREPNDGNVIEDNGGTGVHVLRRDSAVVRDVRILDNIIRRNQNGVALVARNTYEAVPTAATRGQLVSQFIVHSNQIRDNSDTGIQLRTEADAVILANIRYNFIDGNAQHGIRASGLENNDTDFENIGGTWVKNRISNNGQNGISIETVVGHVNPLRIGLDGEDAEFEPFQLGNQSLGNFIFRNGNDGIAIAAQVGLAGTVRPQDSFRNSASIINNLIVENGTNTLAGGGAPDPLTAGRGIRIEIFWGRQGGTGDLREVRIDRNTIQGNFGDGVELRNRGGTARIMMLGNLIDLNGGRGMDILNQTGPTDFVPDAHIVFGRLGTTTVRRIFEGIPQNTQVSNGNIVRSNGLEGFYVVNTASANQTADVDSRVNLLADAAFPSQFDLPSNLMLDMENNAIRDNGRGITETGSPASTLSGTGLVMRVGTTNGADFFGTVADVSGNLDPRFDPETGAASVGTNTSEYGNGRVNARIVTNDFSGNAGDDVFIESFTSTVDPPTTPGTWSEKEFKDQEPTYTRDPLSRLNVVFRGNTGDSLDVSRGWFDANGDTNNAGAHYDNAEGDHKSRTFKQAPNPSGPFPTNLADRDRNATRVADRPSSLGGLALAWPGFTGDFSGASSGFGAPFVGPNRPDLFSGQITSVDATNPNGPILVSVAGRGAVIEDAPNRDGSTVILSRGHRLRTGDLITITGATGKTGINSSNSSTGQWEVVVVNFNEFRLRDPGTGVLVDAGGTYDANSARWALAGSHGLTTGDVVSISGTGIARANGTHAVAVVNQSTFALYVPVDVPTFFSAGTPVLGVGPGATSNFGSFVAHNPNSFKYDGIGPSTFRIESNWDVNGFTQNQFGDTFNTLAQFEPIKFDGFAIQYDEVDPGTFSYVTAWIDDVTVNETAGTATFTVHLSEAAKENVFIGFETADGTAVAGSDFAARTGSIFFTPGQTTRTFTVNIANNNAFDQDEHFYVDLVSISGGSLVDSRAFATIQADSDPRPSVSISDTSVFPERGMAVFTVTLSNPSSETIFVDFSTADGTATDGQDYLERVGTLIFNPNETSKTIEVDILPDRIVEPPETFQLRLSNARTTTEDGTRVDLTIADGVGVGTIFDTAFVNLPGQVFVNGHGTGTSDVEITVNLSRPVPNGQTVTLNYETSNGTALAGSDYTAVTGGSVTFTAGESSKTFTVTTANRDTFAEGDEFFFVTFTDGGNAAFANPANTQVRVTIREPGDIVAPGAGVRSFVTVFDSLDLDSKALEFTTYRPDFLGGVSVATGDFNGDGFPDIVVGPRAPGPNRVGLLPVVRIFDGVNGEMINQFFAFGDASSGFRGGIDVATGDLNGDGQLEIIVATSAGARPFVRVFDATGTQLGEFFAFGQNFRGGVDLAAGDVDGDGADEIIAGTMRGTSAVHVFDFDVSTGAATQVGNTIFAFPGFFGGINVSAGDLDGNTVSEIVVGAGSWNGPAFGTPVGPAVAVFNGATGAQIGSTFQAYASTFQGGVSVATSDINGDGAQEIVTGPGPGGGPRVRYFDGTTRTMVAEFLAYGRSLRTGIVMAGRTLGVPGEGSPLHADTSIAPIAGPVESLGQDDLGSIVSAALTRFEAAGLRSDLLAQLGSVEFVIADLGGTLLGLARPGVIQIDDDAAGYGWFVDYSPLLDEEFGRDASGTLTATDSLAAGRMDLLTTVMHELGHELGWSDLDAGQYANDLMTGTLQSGVRRDLDSVFATEDLFDELLTA